MRATPLAEGAARARPLTRSMRALLLAVACVPLFCGLGAWPLFDPDEGRNAAVAREMLDGDRVVPHLDGLPYLDKPALLFWVVAGALRTCGGSEAAARLPAAAAAVATVALTAGLGTLLAGSAVGLTAGIAIATMPLLLVFGRLVIFDAPLTAFVTAALYCLVRARLRGAADLWWPLAGLAIGLAVLTKGPVGLAVPLVAWLAGRGALPRPPAKPAMRPLLAALVAGAAVVLPWVAAVESREPGFLRYALVDETVLRFFSAERFHRGAPVYFYATVLAWGLGAWSVVLIAAVPGLVDARRRSTPSGSAAAFAARAAAAMVVFFTCSASKRPQYVLPALVPVALLVAVGVAAAPGRIANAVARTGRWVALAGVVGMAAASIAYRPVANDFSVLTPAVLAVGGAAFLLWGAVTATAVRGRGPAAVSCAAVLAPGLLLALLGPLRPYAEGRSARALAARIDPAARVVAFQTFQPTLLWYVGRPIVLVSDTGRELTSNYVRARHGRGRLDDRVVPIAALARALDGPGPVCLVVRVDRLASLRRLARRRLIPVAEGEHAVLFAVRA